MTTFGRPAVRGGSGVAGGDVVGAVHEAEAYSIAGDRTAPTPTRVIALDIGRDRRDVQR